MLSSSAIAACWCCAVCRGGELLWSIESIERAKICARILPLFQSFIGLSHSSSSLNALVSLPRRPVFSTLVNQPGADCIAFSFAQPSLPLNPNPSLFPQFSSRQSAPRLTQLWPFELQPFARSIAMGGLVSKLFHRRRGVDVYDLMLEQIDAELQLTAERRSRHFAMQRKLNRSIALYGLFIYTCIGAFCYLWEPHTGHRMQDKTYKTIPILSFPFALFGLKRINDFIFTKLTKRDGDAIRAIEKRKTDLIDELMDQTNYKKMQLILNKHQRQPQLTPQQQQQQQRMNQQRSPGSMRTPATNQSHQQRAMQNKQTPHSLMQGAQSSAFTTPSHPQQRPTTATQQQSLPYQPPGIVAGQPYMSAQDLARYSGSSSLSGFQDVTRPAVQRTRFDKILDYMLGEGAANRHALICANCYSHNGLMRPEDTRPMEQVRFRCVTCNFINGDKLEKDWKPKIYDPHQNTQQTADSILLEQFTALKPGIGAIENSQPLGGKNKSTAQQQASLVHARLAQPDEDQSLFFSTQPKTADSNKTSSANVKTGSKSNLADSSSAADSLPISGPDSISTSHTASSASLSSHEGLSERSQRGEAGVFFDDSALIQPDEAEAPNTDVKLSAAPSATYKSASRDQLSGSSSSPSPDAASLSESESESSPSVAVVRRGKGKGAGSEKAKVKTPNKRKGKN